MKKRTQKQTSKQTNKKTTVKFDKNDNTVFESIIQTPKGNKNVFKIINDKKEPDFRQRIAE